MRPQTVNTTFGHCGDGADQISCCQLFPDVPVTSTVEQVEK